MEKGKVSTDRRASNKIIQGDEQLHMGNVGSRGAATRRNG